MTDLPFLVGAGNALSVCRLRAGSWEKCLFVSFARFKLDCDCCPFVMLGFTPRTSPPAPTHARHALCHLTPRPGFFFFKLSLVCVRMSTGALQARRGCQFPRTGMSVVPSYQTWELNSGPL